MAFHEFLEPAHREFLAAQPVFFVATAPREGRINLSPKGLDSLRVLDERRVAWLDLTGSGNETAAHLLDDGRLTLMACSFGERPLILRLYGRARSVRPGDAEWDGLVGLFPPTPGTRQVFVLDVASVQTSCGFAVPRMDLVGERETLVRLWEKRGPEEAAAYRQEKNRASIDGLPTGIGAGEPAPD